MRSNIRAALRSSCRPALVRPIRRHRAGFTLLEVLIATAITLLMMISLVQVFKVISDSMKQGRAALQMNNTLRTVTSRLRQDLSNLTVRVDPPSDNTSGGGYFEIYDGSMTDYSAALFATDAPKSNRFGDTDDIAMFTSRAGSSWFTGQVPQYILTGVAADTAPVVITSQLAEIAVFARPVRSPATPVTQAFDDFDGNGFPDGFRLHYRVLLIRPDLNTEGPGAIKWLPVLSVPSATDTPTTMANYFAICDLSMHRVYDGNPATTADTIAANSLEDLTNPANRFAHYQYSLVGQGSNASTTMPLLVLDPISLAVTTAGLYPETDPTTLPAQLQGAAGNYLHSAYVLGGDPAGVGVARLGEDVIANNVLAFDIKGYDPGAPIIATQGTDGGFGVATGGTPAFTGVAGQDGSDDLVLTPNDPGYAAAYAGTIATVSYGEYVDLMWGRKTMNSLSAYSLTYTGTGGIASVSPNFFTALSGIEFSTNAAGWNWTDGMQRSGKVLNHTGGTSNIFILQPTYDTWTGQFDSNGTPQNLWSSISGVAGDIGIVDINGMARRNGWGGSTDAVTTIDPGNDGIDNNSTGGVDETAERETQPPFPIKLRGVKISVRIEDLNSRQIKQMSVANEFATQ